MILDLIVKNYGTAIVAIITYQVIITIIKAFYAKIREKPASMQAEIATALGMFIVGFLLIDIPEYILNTPNTVLPRVGGFMLIMLSFYILNRLKSKRGMRK